MPCGVPAMVPALFPALFPALASAPAYPLDPAASPLVMRADVWRAPPFSSRLRAAVPVTVVTVAAPNGNGRLPLAVPLRGSAYEQYFRQRMRCVLYAAHAAGCSTIVLGVWGCGVFHNRPEVLRRWWPSFGVRCLTRWSGVCALLG